MNLEEYIFNLESINKEVFELRKNTNECELYIEQLMNGDPYDKLHIKELFTGDYNSLYIDNDLFVNVLNEQIAKNNARLLELHQELLCLKDKKLEL